VFQFSNLQNKELQKGKAQKKFCIFFVFVVPYQSPNLTYQAVNQNQTGKVD
jgi:hypothetical protein